jgi:hypothetical protein
MHQNNADFSLATRLGDTGAMSFLHPIEAVV